MHDIREQLRIVWTALDELQSLRDKEICEYEESVGEDCWSQLQKQMNEQERDNICTAMAHIHEELGVPHEDI